MALIHLLLDIILTTLHMAHHHITPHMVHHLMESHPFTLTLDMDLALGDEEDVVVGQEVEVDEVDAAQKLNAATVEERSVTVMQQTPIQVKSLWGHHFFMLWERVLPHSWVHLG